MPSLISLQNAVALGLGSMTARPGISNSARSTSWGVTVPVSRNFNQLRIQSKTGETFPSARALNTGLCVSRHDQFSALRYAGQDGRVIIPQLVPLISR